MKRQTRSQSTHRHSYHPGRVVFESQDGALLRCASCGALELRFGNAIIGLADNDLDLLSDAIGNFDASPVGATPHHMEHGLIYIGNTGNGYRFSREQITELHRLLVGAQLMLQLNGNPTTADESRSE